jgi:hypothetical protein
VQQLLFEALEGRPDEIDRFLGVLSGAVPIRSYFSPRNLLRLLGAWRMLKVALARRRMVGLLAAGHRIAIGTSQ